MKRVMISQPMKNKSKEEIIKVREDAVNLLEDLNYKVIDTYFENKFHNKYEDNNSEERNVWCVVNIPIFFLAKSLEKMAECDAVYFCKGWKEARGCICEHKVAEMYNLEILYEENYESNTDN